MRTLVGHITHPLVRCGLFLEHGCEKTHNDAMRKVLVESGFDPAAFGWASVQLDGGIDAVMDKVCDWFDRSLAQSEPLGSAQVGLDQLRLGLMAVEPIQPAVARSLLRLAAIVVAGGGTVVLPQAGTLAGEQFLAEELGVSDAADPTLAYGQRAGEPGLHLMDTPTAHGTETLGGLAATGVDVMLAHVGPRPLQAHPMVPLVQVAAGQTAAADMDLVLDLTRDADRLADDLLEMVLQVASRRYRPKLFAAGYTDFQITRGRLGISL